METFEILLALVLANIVVGLVCSFVARRAWGHWLCVVAIAVNVFPILLALDCLLGMATGRYSPVRLIVVLSLCILVEALWLLFSLGRYRRPQPPAS